MKIKSEFILHQIGKEYILLHDGTTNVDFSNIINLNHTAVYLWQRFHNEEFEIEDMITALAARYDVTPDQARQDTETFIRSLKDCGILD